MKPLEPAFPRSSRHGLRWFQIDVTYALLRVLAATGVVWDLREPMQDEDVRR